VERLDWSLDAAFEEFCKARQPGIYKEDYIIELYEKYNPGEDIVPDPPQLPAWHTECDDEDEDEQEEESDSVRQSKNRNIKIVKKSFIDDIQISGVDQVMNCDIVFEVQRTVKNMFKSGKKGFLGAQPVSMTRKNLDFLSKKSYMVSWKADGTRFLMLIQGKNKVYMLDRDNVVFKVSNLNFFHRKSEGMNNFLEQTLVDGELVIDEHQGKKIPRFLIYDIIKFQGEDVGQCAFKRRALCIEKELIAPRNQKCSEGKLNKTEEPFSVRKKDFWELSTVNVLLDKNSNFCKVLSHEIDGLIFQPAGPNDFYKSGRCDDILKWKPASMNSIDFRLQIGIQSGTGLLPTLKGNLFVGHYDLPFSQLKKCTKKMREYDGKIIECTVSDNGWVFMRERTDKSYPNSFNTAKGVMESIKNPVTKEILLQFIAEKSAWARELKGKSQHDKSIMPPPKRRKV